MFMIVKKGVPFLLSANRPKWTFQLHGNFCMQIIKFLIKFNSEVYKLRRTTLASLSD